MHVDNNDDDHDDDYDACMCIDAHPMFADLRQIVMQR